MTAENWAVIAASVVPVLAALGWVLRKVGKAVYLLFGDDDHPGLHAWQRIISEKLENIDAGNIEILRRLYTVEHELHPNKGMSLRDSVTRIEQMVAAESRKPEGHTP